MPYVDATPLPPDLALEPWDDAAARWRLDRLRDALPVRIPADAVFSTGASNDVWIFGETVLRVCWRGDRDRLLREAALTAVLPPGVPHATVLGSGRTDDVGWTLSEFIPGTPMDQVVERSSVGDARELFGRYAEILATLNDWAPPAEISALMDDRPSIRSDDLLSTWASDLMPFPLERALTMIDLAREVPHLDPALLDATRDRLVELAPFDPFAAGDTTPRSVVHADATPGNLLVRDGRIVALLDFEWARWAPRDHELPSIVRMVQPEPAHTPRNPLRDLPVLTWLAEDYPRLFDHPHLDERLWLSELVYILHGVIWWPPDQPEASLTPEHHVHTLRRLVDAPWPR